LLAISDLGGVSTLPSLDATYGKQIPYAESICLENISRFEGYIVLFMAQGAMAFQTSSQALHASVG
jgi:hypothetical protein